jgi:hypothetical protein
MHFMPSAENACIFGGGLKMHAFWEETGKCMHFGLGPENACILAFGM